MQYLLLCSFPITFTDTLKTTIGNMTQTLDTPGRKAFTCTTTPTHKHTLWMNELWHGTPEAKQWDVLRNGWDGWSEGQGANLQVGQAGWPLLRAAAGVCADTWRHVAVKWICVPRLCYIVAWRHLPTNKEQHFGVKLHTSLKHTHVFNVFQPVVWDKCLCKIQQISHFTHLQ